MTITHEVKLWPQAMRDAFEERASIHQADGETAEKAEWLAYLEVRRMDLKDLFGIRKAPKTSNKESAAPQCESTSKMT